METGYAALRPILAAAYLAASMADLRRRHNAASL